MTLEERNKYILENKIVDTTYPISKKFKDLSGQIINGIEFLEYVGKDKCGIIYYKCKCHCGNIFIASNSNRIKSCGCMNHDITKNIVDTTYPTSKSFKDLSGQVINGIEFLEYVGKGKRRGSLYKCKCHCGNIFISRSGSIKNGVTKSCGCALYNKQNKNNISDVKNNPIYDTIYIYTINYAKAHNYIVCDEWLGDNGFDNFHKWILSKGFSKNKNILRKDINKPYSPDNCILVDSKISKIFYSRGRYITIGNYKYPLCIWSKIVGISLANISQRINKLGWKEKDAVLTPLYGIPGIDVIEFTVPPEYEEVNGCCQ